MRYLINNGVINNMMRMLLVTVLLLGMAGTVSACLAGHTCVQKCFIVTSQDGGIKISGATVTMKWYSMAQDATVTGTTDSNGKVCLDGTKLVNEVDRNYRLEVVATNYITYSVPFEGSDWINVADLGPTDADFSVYMMSLPKDSNGLYDGVACTVGHPEFKTYCVYPARIPMNQYDVYIKYIWDGQEKVNWLSTLNAQAGWLPYGIDKIYCLQGDVNDYFACLGGVPPKKSIQFKVEYYNKDLLCRYTGWCSTGQFSSKIWSTTFTSADCYKDSDCATGQICDLTFKRCVSVVTPYAVNPKSIFTMVDKPAIYAKPDSPKVCKSASTAFYTCSRYSNSEFYFTVTRKKTIDSNWFTPIDLQQGFDIQDAFEDICPWSLRLSNRPAYDTCLKNNILPFTFDFKVDIYVVGYGGIFKKVSTMDQKSVKIEHCDDTNVDRQCHLETCDDIGGICAVTSCIGSYCTSDSGCSKCTYGCGGGRINTKCFDNKCEPVAQCCNFDDDCSCNTKSGCNTKNIYHDTSADYTKPHYCGQRADYFKITRDWQSGQTTPYNPVVSYCRVGGDEAALCSKPSDCVSGVCTGSQSSNTCVFRDPKILGSMNYCFTSSGGQSYVDGYCYKTGGGSSGPMISQCNTCTVNSDCLACSYYCSGSQVDPSTLVCSSGKCRPASGACLGICYTEGICLKSGGQLIPCNYEVGTPNNKDSYCQNYLPKGYYSYCTAKLESNFHSDLTRGFCQHGKLADGQPCARPSWCISEKCPISDPETIMGTCGGGCHADGYKINTGENINDCCSKKTDGSPITTECPDEFNVRHIYCGNVNCESACKPAGYKLDQGEDAGVVCCVDPVTSTRHAVDCYGVNYCAGTGFSCGATTTTTTTTLPGGGYCDFDACKDYVTATPGIGDGFAKAKAEPTGVLDIYGRGQPVTDADGNYIHGQNGELIYNGCGCNPQSDTDAGIDRYYCAPNPNIEPGKSGVCKELRKDGETCGRGGDQTASYGDWVCRSFNCVGDVLNPDSKDVKCQSETFMCSANAGYGSVRDPEYYCHCEITDKDRPNIDVGGRDGDEAGVCATIYAPDLTEDQIRGNLASSGRWCFSQDLGTYNPGGSQNTPDNKCKAKYQPGETCGADYQCVTGSCMDHICTDYTFSKTKVLGEGCHIINKLNGQTSYTIWNRLDNGEDKGVVLWDDDCNDDTSDGSLYCDACSTTGRVYGSISNGLPVESDIKCSDYDVPHMGVGICKRTQLEGKWCYAHTQCNSDVHQMSDGIKEVLVCTSSSTYGFDCSRDNYYCTAGQTEKANKYCAFRPVKPCIHDEKEPLDKFDQKSDETCYNLQQLGELVSDKDLFCSDEHMCTLPGSDDMKECEKFTKDQRPNVVHSFGECVANYCEKKPEPFISMECMRAPGYWSTTGSNP